MTSVLIVVTWLQLGGPQVSMQRFETRVRCEAARAVVARMLIEQARTNLVGLHELVPAASADRGNGQATSLRTAATGREIARLQCS